ncbi:hypothetical protein [Paenibacillus campi]|uniref:hypothetical protein n=1 Tax=Paenibacillus campi TaxID=3106031 RepID=UPI002AFFC233|nr:hypothetical protein [Paenibacillus sp. SGZ-1014]
MSSKKKAFVGMLLFGALSSSFVYAATSYQSFSGTVPGINSSWYSSTQFKSTSNALAGLKLNSTGGATLDARTNSGAGNGAWTRAVSGGNTYSLDSPQVASAAVQLELNTNFFQGSVPVTGQWRSN